MNEDEILKNLGHVLVSYHHVNYAVHVTDRLQGTRQDIRVQQLR